MELQTIYTKVLQHLAKQGCAALDEHGLCEYLTDQGLKCAVGYLIPQAHYRKDIEQQSVDDEEGTVLQLLSYIYGPSVDASATAGLLAELQAVHDDPLTALTNHNSYSGTSATQVVDKKLIQIENRYDVIRPKVFNEAFGL